MRLSLIIGVLSALVCGPLGFLRAQSEAVPVPALMPSPVAESTDGGWRFTAEYVVFWLREGHVPAILTTSSPASRGLLGQPDTRLVYGDQRLETRHADRFVGVRGGLDWMSADGEFGFEGRTLFLERDSTYFKAYSPDGSRFLALSFINAQTGQQASRVISGLTPQGPILAGGFVGYSRIELFNEEANFVLPLAREQTWRIDLLAGTRFLQMRDRFESTATSWVLPDRAILGSAMDNFRTSNAFYGAQVGLRGEAQFDRLFVQMRGTIALGGDAQRVQTFGQSLYATPTTRIEVPYGLYVQPSNSGDHHRVALDGVSEVGANLGYQIMPWLRAQVGYTLLAWFNPLRAGDQVDRVVNTQQATTPTPASPGIPYKGETFWAQGVSVGLEARW